MYANSYVPPSNIYYWYYMFTGQVHGKLPELLPVTQIVASLSPPEHLAILGEEHCHDSSITVSKK